MAVPLLALGLAAGAAAAGVGGSAGAAGAGVGMNRTNTTNFGKTDQYDPNRFEYGGVKGLGNATANRYNENAYQAQFRNAPTAQYGLANVTRLNQQQMAQQMEARAMGLVPSIAGQQADIDMQRAQAAQQAQAASARGPGGLALAQQNAANNTAQSFGQISNQAQVNAAQERLAAEQAAFGAYGDMRGLDERRAEYGADLAMRQRQQNDAYTLGNYNLANDVRSQQTQANMNQQGLLAGSFQAEQAARMGQNQQNANRSFDYFKMALGAGQGGAQQMSQMATPKAEGGPVSAGGLYLVGEQGPELMVAPTDGTIIPNHALGGLASPMSGPAEQLGATGGMNVGASYRAHSRFGTRFARNPTGSSD
jgi:hypothetical protein